MKINVHDIKPGGIEVDGQVTLEEMDFAKTDEIKYVAPLKIKAKVEKVQNSVLAKAQISSQYASLCARCLDEVERKWSKSFMFEFAIKSQSDSIDIGDLVRQEAILNLPARVLCGEDCKGICMDCGANLNHEKCTCPVKAKQGHVVQLKV